MKSILYGLILSACISFPLFADTVKAYQIKYATYFGGYVKYYGANTWHHYSYLATGDQMKELAYMGSKDPKSTEPYKLYIANRCFQIVITVNPPETTYRDITEYIPVNKAGGGKQYLENIYTSKNKYVNANNPKPDGKKIVVAGYVCDGYIGKGTDGKYMSLYFSKDPVLAPINQAIFKPNFS
ncbi:MAG: hypothetical protein HPY53_00005 [Brevinematales bacterium]|nr:hypothetical protein [Brevinematales bacterium]